MNKLSSFIEKYGITGTVTPTDQTPPVGFPRGSRAWEARLEHQGSVLLVGSVFTVPYFTGPGIAGTPTIEDILDCVGDDAVGYENTFVQADLEKSFENWAGDYGYDTDSRKGYRIWENVRTQSKNLKNFLGEAAYEELLFDTERE